MSMKNEELKQLQPVARLPEPSSTNEGIFKRSDFAKTVTSLIGNSVKVKTKSGSTYEGVFTEFSSDCEVVISLSGELDENDPFHNSVSGDKLIFKPDDIVSISCVNVSLKDALDLPQHCDRSGDLVVRGQLDLWEERHGTEASFADREWEANRIMRPNAKDRDFNDGIRGFVSSSYSCSSEFNQDLRTSPQRVSKMDEAYEDDDIPKPQRNRYPEEFSKRVTDEGSSNLNPYAKPFTPMEMCLEPEHDEGIPSMAAVVLPTYVVSACSSPAEPTRCFGKLDVGQGSSPAAPASSFLSPGSIPNQYLHCATYGDDYDDKLYPWYDAQPVSAHDYQQYYPHLQYIQYFRRFY